MTAGRRFTLSAVGRDRPGIVAAVTGVLLDHRVNLEDSQMAILGGRFSMMLIVAVPDEAGVSALRDGLQAMSQRVGLDALSLDELAAEAPSEDLTPTHMVSVYGVDHPGIVHAVSSALAADEIGITDLTTKLVSDPDEEPLYVMMLEIALPAGADAGRLERKLGEIAAKQRVDLTLRELEQDAL
jgi:glycine cleavage system transcriptional repressor